MATKCSECKADMIEMQVSLHFLVGTEWSEVPVLAGICQDCGWMNFHAATPQQLMKRLADVKQEGFVVKSRGDKAEGPITTAPVRKIK